MSSVSFYIKRNNFFARHLTPISGKSMTWKSQAVSLLNKTRSKAFIASSKICSGLYYPRTLRN